MCKCRCNAKFAVYVLGPCGSKTRGAVYKDAKDATKRMTFLRQALSPSYTVVLYDVQKKRAKRTECGLRKPDRCIAGIFGGRVVYQKPKLTYGWSHSYTH